MGEDFEIGGHAYSIGKLDAFTQLNCLRRVAPLLTGATGFISGLPVDENGKPVVANFSEIITNSAPLLEAVVKLNDADVEYVISKCLAATSRRQAGGTGYVVVWGPGGLQFQDIDMVTMLQLCSRVLRDALLPFLSGPASRSSGAAA